MSHRVTAEATAVAGDAQAASEAVGLRRLRVFIVSFVFPPFNVIGAVRVGKQQSTCTAWGMTCE